MKTELESSTQRKMQAIIKEYGGWVLKTHGSIYSPVGTPDLLGCVPVTVETLQSMVKKKLLYKTDKVGMFLAIEVKRENQLEDVSEAQTIVGDKIRNSSGLWFAMDNPKDLIGLLETLEVKRKE
jgi:hypothetical protein